MKQTISHISKALPVVIFALSLPVCAGTYQLTWSGSGGSGKATVDIEPFLTEETFQEFYAYGDGPNLDYNGPVPEGSLDSGTGYMFLLKSVQEDGIGIVFLNTSKDGSGFANVAKAISTFDPDSAIVVKDDSDVWDTYQEETVTVGDSTKDKITADWAWSTGRTDGMIIQWMHDPAATAEIQYTDSDRYDDYEEAEQLSSWKILSHGADGPLAIPEWGSSVTIMALPLPAVSLPVTGLLALIVLKKLRGRSKTRIA